MYRKKKKPNIVVNLEGFCVVCKRYTHIHTGGTPFPDQYADADPLRVH